MESGGILPITLLQKRCASERQSGCGECNSRHGTNRPQNAHGHGCGKGQQRSTKHVSENALENSANSEIIDLLDEKFGQLS